MAALIGVVLLVGVVTAYFSGSDEEQVSEAKQKTENVRVVTVPSAPAAPARPTSGDMAACNDYAASVRANPANEALKHGLIGGAVGAGVGAATGAIAKGGKGAGKGAGIGAIVGATAGTLYGLNKANQNNAASESAYRTCMADRGY
jgi:hypothetical protein